MADNLITVILGIVIGIILIVAVAIPITEEVVTDANLSGTTATVVGFISLFLGIGALVLSTGIFQRT